MKSLLRILRILACSTPQLLLVPSAPAAPQFSNKTELPSFETILPADLIKDAQAGLALALAQAEGKQTLRFQSAESSWASGAAIINQVTFHAGYRLDFWLLRQRQNQDQGEDPQHWPFFAIILDRQPRPKVAYFMQFAPTPVIKGSLPQPIALAVSCSRCHANGPRRIRPETSLLTATLTESDRQRLQSWNQHIAEDGPVAQVEKFAAQSSPLAQQRQNEVLQLPICSECHSKESGIRSELFRAHRQSIRFLLQTADHSDGYTGERQGREKAAMPLEGSMQREDSSCLEQWLRAKPLGKDCVQAGTRTSHEAKSMLTVTVTNSLSSFDIKALYLDGALQPEGPSTIRIITDQATSGNGLRDKHMRERFLDAAGPITVRIDSLTPLKKAGSSFTLPVTLSWHGFSRLVPVQLEARGSVLAVQATIDLTDFGWPLPQFLGLSLGPELKIRGQIDAGPLAKL